MSSSPVASHCTLPCYLLPGAVGGEANPSAFPYPNAGLAAGRAGPLRRLWRALDLWPGEDDQAVLTDAALQLGPQRIVLDYGQVQWWVGSGREVMQLFVPPSEVADDHS